MKRLGVMVLSLAAASACCFAQQWEFGGVGGGGFLSNVNVSGPAGSATAGFSPGFVAGAFFGQNLYNHLSGEIRYEYQQNDLYLQSGGQKTTFSGDAHLVHYDLLIHTGAKGARAQFFVAIGGGLKIFRGTGTPAAYQPLYQFGYLTHTQQLKPMGTAGVGVKFNLSDHVLLRLEIHDFITGFPTQVITPPTGVKYGSILQDLVPMVGLGYVF